MHDATDVQSTPESCTALDGVEQEQLAAFRFLADPANHPVSAVVNSDGSAGLSQKIDVVHTHCAHLFLSSCTVYKIKRAVTYSYVDMSTLEKRRLLCERELALNQPTLPDIYQDVVPITRESNGTLAIDGDGSPVEWALRMKRFDESQVLSSLAERAELTLDLAKRLGRSLAGYHDTLPSAPVNDGHARIHEVVVELIEEFAGLDRYLPAPLVQRFDTLATQACNRCQCELDARAAHGFVKRCHGDLHLRNLVMHEGTPVPFDALEFDERMATTDVLYDLAFLLMDMQHRDLQVQQNIVFNEYLLHSASAHIDALGLLPLFLSCRAGIRAMTTAQTASLNSSQAKAPNLESTRYLEQAIACLETRHAALIAVGGLSGTGKSTIAARLAPQLGAAPGALLIRSDVERKHALGLEETDTLDDHQYTPASARQNYLRVIDKARRGLRAGQCVMVDATFLSESARKGVEDLARVTGVAFTGLWLTAPAATLRQRIEARTDDASDADVAVLDKQLDRLASEEQPGPGWQRIDASGPIQTTLAQSVSASRHHQSSVSHQQRNLGAT